MRVLVCGGRDYQRDSKLTGVLKFWHLRLQFTEVIHGAARGADRLAGEWARRNKIKTRPFPAHWAHDKGCSPDCAKVIGPGAGPARNQRMLDEGKPEIVIAFPGGTGTADMVRRAHIAGVEVIEVPE